MDYNQVFEWCVDFLKFYAKRWNMTYEELNIWIFCIIEPIVFVLMCIIILIQQIRIWKFKKRLGKGKVLEIRIPQLESLSASDLGESSRPEWPFRS